MSNHELAVLFFLQLAFILIVIRVVSVLAKKIGQPQVIGEMIAGVMMGPSLFGAFWPELQAQLFPQSSISIIYAVSQVGLVLYMFLIGVEFNVDLIRQRLRSAALVSMAGIIAPFALGGALAFFIMKEAAFFSAKVTAWEAMLFPARLGKICLLQFDVRLLILRSKTRL